MESFTGYKWEHGAVHVLEERFGAYMMLLCQRTGPTKFTDSEMTIYGYVQSSPCILTTRAGSFHLSTGMYFSCPGSASIEGGQVMLIFRKNYRGVLHMGGPVERRGRLRYIDGCTDSLLIPPQRLGEPCLNLLYFPPGIEQTMHTHPSVRAGLILSGHGACDTPAGEIALTPGMPFRIHTDGPHRFRTPFGEEMRVLAFHPDSDFGPTDEEHPMLNRTIVDGDSAKNQPAIRSGRGTPVEYELS